MTSLLPQYLGNVIYKSELKAFKSNNFQIEGLFNKSLIWEDLNYQC